MEISRSTCWIRISRDDGGVPGLGQSNGESIGVGNGMGSLDMSGSKGEVPIGVKDLKGQLVNRRNGL